jgi:hypothetical protein
LRPAIYQDGEHLQSFDEEKLTGLLTHVGFARVEPTEFDAALDVDSDIRRQYSLYVTAVK